MSEIQMVVCVFGIYSRKIEKLENQIKKYVIFVTSKK